MMDSMEIISSFSFNPFVLCHEPTILLNASKTYIKKTATTRFSYSTNARRGIHITASPAISNSSSKKKKYLKVFFILFSPQSRLDLSMASVSFDRWKQEVRQVTTVRCAPPVRRRRPPATDTATGERARAHFLSLHH